MGRGDVTSAPATDTLPGMAERWRALLLAGSLVVLAACSTSAGADEQGAVAPGVDRPTADGTSPGSAAATDAPPSAAPSSSEDAASTAATDSAAAETEPTEGDVTTTGSDPEGDDDAGADATDPQPDETTTSEAASTTSSSSTTTTTTVPDLPVHDPSCVYVIEPGDSLSLIADKIDDPEATVDFLRGENFLQDADTIHAGEYLDICVNNGIDDISGEERANPAIVEEEYASAVEVQQAKLNELLVPLGMPEMPVDGISGPITRQRLCAARLGLGLPLSTTDMEPGSDEEQTLLAADSIKVPWNRAVTASRWALVDRTCQVMFVGTDTLAFVFPVSTGEEEYETDLQDKARAFRYDPALDNEGWHDSTTYPVPEDNPLNGNMYKPIYFNGGEAIHGASVVPPYPRSKGCVRLRVESQNQLVAWLGLDGVGGPVWDRGQINLAVSVQGDYVG